MFSQQTFRVSCYPLSALLNEVAGAPSVSAKLDEEYRKLKSQRIDEKSFDALAYTKQVVLETMRLFPAAWAIGRELTSPMTYKNVTFPPKSSFILSQYHTHRNPRLWPEPEAFRPERFEEELVKNRHPFAFFPFGGGQRVCIASYLAMTEALIVIPTLLRQFHFEGIADQTPKISADITLNFESGLFLRVSPR